MKPSHIPAHQSQNLSPYLEQAVHRVCCLRRIYQLMESGAVQSAEAFTILLLSLKLYCENLLCFYRVSGNPVTFSNAPGSATVLQHQRANSKQAFLLPPDVLEAAGLCQRRNILHPGHLWFQLVTVSNVFLKEPPLRDWFW